MIVRVASFFVCSAVFGLALAGCGDSKSSSEGAPPTLQPTSPAQSVSTGTQSTSSTPVSTPSPTAMETGGSAPTTSTSGSGGDGSGSDPVSAAAVAAYDTYLQKQAASLVVRATEFSTALQRGNPQRAVRLYPHARTLYERISAVSGRVREGLGTEIAGQQGDVPSGQWAGFHKIEKILFDTGTTVDTEKPGRDLVADVTELRRGVDGLLLDPGSIAAVALALLRDASGAPLDGKEERWSHTDITDVAANVGGVGAAWSAIRPIVAARDPKLVASVNKAYKEARLIVESFKVQGSYRHYDELGPGEVGAIREKLGRLNTQLQKVPPLLGA
jgi:iron uptake system component EfeO